MINIEIDNCFICNKLRITNRGLIGAEFYIELDDVLTKDLSILEYFLHNIEAIIIYRIKHLGNGPGHLVQHAFFSYIFVFVKLEHFKVILQLLVVVEALLFLQHP